MKRRFKCDNCGNRIETSIESTANIISRFIFPAVCPNCGQQKLFEEVENNAANP